VLGHLLAQGKVSQTNLRAVEPSATSQYVQLSFYASTDCSGGVQVAQLVATNLCIPATLTGTPLKSVMVTTNQNAITVTQYSDNACTTMIGSTSSTPQGCGTATGSIYGSATTAIVSSPQFTNGIYSSNYLQSSSCTSNTMSSAALVFYAPFCSTGAAYSVQYTINGNSVTAQQYSGQGCTGNAGTAVTFNTNCNTMQTAYVDNTQTGQSIQVMVYTAFSATPTSSPSSSPSSSTCFSKHDMVTLENGVSKPMHEVTLQDRVLAYSAEKQSFEFSDVIALPHSADNAVKTVFRLLSTESGADIKLTPCHLLPAGPCGSDGAFDMKYAESVSVGECMLTVDGESRVTRNDRVEGEGIFTVVPAADQLVVNNIVASPFAISHKGGNLLYSIPRAVHAWAPNVYKSVVGSVFGLGQWMSAMLMMNSK